MAPVHWAAGSDGETNFGLTSLAAPNAASSSVARYSFVARLTACASSSLFHCEPGVDRCLLASATIRLVRLRFPPGALAVRRATPLGIVLFDHVEGMLFGPAIGDSLGNTTEGQPPKHATSDGRHRSQP